MFASAGFADRTTDAFVSELRRLAWSGEVSETEDTLTLKLSDVRAVADRDMLSVRAS